MDEASYQMQRQLQQQQQQQQQYSYYNNLQRSYANQQQQPPEYNMSMYSNLQTNNNVSGYVHKTNEGSGQNKVLPPPTYPPPPPPVARPAPPPPPQYTTQPYYQYATTQPNYSLHNLPNQQNHTVINNYGSYSHNNQMPNSNQIYSNTINQNIYTNYITRNNQNKSSSSSSQQNSPSKIKTQYSPNKSTTANTLKNLDVGELKKYIKHMSITSNNKLELNDNINEDLSELASSSVISRSGSLALPKYMKPRICRSPMLVHLVKSKQIVKPKAQIAISPLPENEPMIGVINENGVSTTNQQKLEESLSEIYQNFVEARKESGELLEHKKNNVFANLSNYQRVQQTQLPLPPMSLAGSSEQSGMQILNELVKPPNWVHRSPSHSHPSQYNHSLKSTQRSTSFRAFPAPPPPPPTSIPPPPGQRPISPPSIPPPIHRNNNNNNNNQTSFVKRSNTINSSLLNSLLNSSIQSNQNKTAQQHGGSDTYENSFNNSIGSNATMHNNSMFNNSATLNNGNNFPNANHHAMLLSPNLHTLYDKKKEPPPPYPGRVQEQQQMDTTEDTEADEMSAYNTNLMNNSSASKTTASSVVRYCSPQAYKFYMEQHAENILKNHKAREFRRNQLENEMSKVDLPPTLKDQMRRLLRQKETNYLRLRRAKMNKSMFEHIKVLGLGAFGQVDLVRKRDDSQRLYAMKILHKTDIFNRNQAAHVKAERDILAEADNEWVVKLYYSFQDEESLYFVMDYVPGGDLMNLLIKLQIFSEELSRFYIGELTCAIESVHNLGFIHRDIKPDNILIDKNGHIKLTDFGLCTGFHWTHNSKIYQTDHTYNKLLEQKLSSKITNTNDKRQMAHSLVGTPNYIAPEILSRKGYTKSCDWWSVGVILYEMLVGEPPFRDETALGTQSKVINWKNTLKIPIECELSGEANDLIFKLCTSAENRLGATGIKTHSFFKNYDIGPNMRLNPAPYVPPIKHPTDTSNFEPVDDSALASRQARHGRERHGYAEDEKANYSNNSMLYEFTFRRFFDEATQSTDTFLYDRDKMAYASSQAGSFTSLIRSMTTVDKQQDHQMIAEAQNENKENNTADEQLKAPISPIPSVPETTETADMLGQMESSDGQFSVTKQVFNGNQRQQAQIFKASDNNVLLPPPPPPPYQLNSFINKMAVGSSSNSVNSVNAESKENRKEQNQAPIFV